MFKSRRLSVILAGAGTIAGGAGLPLGAASAAESAEGAANLDEIVVTARKREEKLQDVPVTVTVISSTQLKESGIERIDDIQSEVTNLILSKSQTNTINAVIRGVGSFRNVNGVGFFYDDIQDFSAYSQRLFDVDHVEVLKGPQATLYGGLNIGGAIKYVLKQPEFDWSGEADATAGSYNQHTEEVTLTGPIVGHSLAFRLSAYAEHQDGYFNNLYTGGKLGAIDDIGGRFALLGDFDKLQAYFEVRGNNYSTNHQQLLTSVTSPNDVNYNVYIQDPVYNHADTVAPSLKLDFKLGQSITLTSITGYSFTRNDLLFDSQSAMAPAGSGIPYYALVRNYRDTSDTSYQQELRLTSGTDSPLTWIAGAYFLKRVTPYPGDTQVLSPPPFFSPMSTVDYDVKFDDEQYAGFGSASYRFAEKWEATVGLRVNRSQNTYTDFLHNETVVVGGAREVIPAGTPSEVDETAVLPRGEVSYHFNPDLMLYASVSEGVQPGAASVITSTTGQPFEREKTTAYELGEKGEFLDHRLRLNSAFFYTKYSDRTFTSTVIPPGGGPIRLNANIGGATNIGFEVDITAKPTSEISLHAGLGYIKSTWDKGTRYTYINLGLPPARRAPITADISGLSSPTTPSWTFDASTEWAHPLTGDLTLKVRGDVEFVSKQYFDLLDTYSENSYTIGNALVGIDYRNYSAYFQVHNMGNTRYNTDYFPRRDNGSPTDLANPGEPRMFSVTLSAKF